MFIHEDGGRAGSTDPETGAAAEDASRAEPTRQAAAKPAAKKTATRKKTAKPKKPAPAQTEGGALIVTGPKRGRRRAGIDFGSHPVRVPLKGLSTTRRKAIETDPQLTVEVDN